MNIELLVNLRELHDAVDAESTKVEAAKDVLREAQAKLAAFIEDNQAELAELRAAAAGRREDQADAIRQGQAAGA